MAEQYRQRLERLWPVTLSKIPENQKDIKRFIEAKKEKGVLVSLDTQGQTMNSEVFGRWVTQASRDLYFFAWGADGPPKMPEKNGMKSVSLSPRPIPANWHAFF